MKPEELDKEIEATYNEICKQAEKGNELIAIRLFDKLQIMMDTRRRV